ncbi:MAG: helix-turn-helix transcriptional regulator [Flavobacteriales bacterium]|nr:helix-turn-helix transcriptional regulator [Flavobacteriales bacterium]
MEVVFLIGTIQAVFLAALVLIKKNKMLADKILAIWLLFMGLHLFSYYMNVVGTISDYPILDAFSVSFPMLEGAFTFLYVSIITSKIQRLKWNYLIHVSHYIIFTGIIFLTVYGSEASPSEVICTLKNEYTSVIFWTGLFNIYLGPGYMIASLLLLKKHQRNIDRNFSYTEEIDLKWLKYVLGIMILVWIVVVVTNVLNDYTDLITDRTGGDLIYGSVTIAIFFYGFFGIKQQIIYSAPSVGSINDSTKKVKETPVNQYQKSGLKKDDAENYLKQLMNYMEEETPYLDGKLSLKEVASALEISTNHLSQVINENLEKNFFDFINGYRVDLVKQKMDDPSNKNYTLLALAYDCGFNSKSSFNSIFKKYTGHTPSQYLNTH